MTATLMTEDEAVQVAEIHRLTAFFDELPESTDLNSETQSSMTANATNIAKRLLLLQRDHVRSSPDLGDPIAANYDLMHVALDVMGAPPEEEFCRDVWYGLFDQMVLDHDDVDRLIELMEYVATGKRTDLMPAGRGLHQVVVHLYPELAGAAC